MLQSNRLPLPPAKPLPWKISPNMSFAYVWDDVFPLQEHIMRPYPGRLPSKTKRIFYYRLLRTPRIEENAFEILATRFRVFRRPLMVNAVHAELVVKVAVVLHNFVRQEAATQYFNPLLVDGENAEGEISLREWRKNENDMQLFDQFKKKCDTSSRLFC